MVYFIYYYFFVLAEIVRKYSPLFLIYICLSWKTVPITKKALQEISRHFCFYKKRTTCTKVTKFVTAL